MTDSTDSEESLERESHHAPNAGELRKILRQLVAGQHETHRELKEIRRIMADINTALTDLQASVQTAVDDLGGGVQALRDALATAQGDLAALQVQDDADKAALAQSLTDTQAAADSIEAQVSALNAATGATPPAPAA